MDKQMMDRVGSSSASGGDGSAEGGELFDLLNPQDQHSHGGSSNNVSDMTKKQEISSSYDFQSIRADGSGNHSSGTNLDGVARNLESGGSILGSDTMTLFKLLEHHEQQKVSCEMGRNAYDVTTVHEIDRTMKKYADNILHTLEGVSSRLVQLEGKAQQLETSVDELMNNSGSANGKLSQLENILREIQTGIQVLRNKQENLETRSQHSKLQQSLKQDQTPSPTENSNPMVSQQATQSSQQSIQPPMPPVSAPPLHAWISLSSPPPHSHHAPNKSLPIQSQNHQLSQYPPQTPSPPQKLLPKIYPHIICRPDAICNERSNAIKRKFSSSYVVEECVEEVVHIGKRNGKRIGGKRWNENDQVNLARAWSCISNSTRNGVNGDEKSFWRGVMKKYNANYCPAGFRSVYALKNYWKLLKKQCFLWKKVLSDFDFQTGGTGVPNDLIKDVKTKFKSLNNGRRFDYKAAYEILNECPKWSAIDVDNIDLQPSAKRRTSADTSQESSEASMPSGSNANTPTSDMHLRSPQKFILEESNEQSSILSLKKQEKKEHLQDMDSLPVMVRDLSKLTPESRIFSREEVKS